MNLMQQYNRKLRFNYGIDKYQLISVQYKAAAIIGGFVVIALYASMSLNRHSAISDQLYPTAIVLGSIICLSIALKALLDGREKRADQVIMTMASVVILGGIFFSGGIPGSSASHIIVVLPIIAFLNHGTKAGCIVAAICFGLGVGQYVLMSKFGLDIPSFKDEGNTAANKLIAWITGYCLILLLLVSFHRKTNFLQNQLHLEKLKLAKLAMTDHLTNLLNARSFYESVDKELSAATDKKALSCYVVYIDLNAFKPINDTYGHQAGDYVLQTVAARLTSCIRDDDIAARLGGDEFALLLRDGLSVRNVDAMVSQIYIIIAKPIFFANQALEVSASIGTVILPTDGETCEEVLKIADSRMYKDKSKNSKRISQAM